MVAIDFTTMQNMCKCHIEVPCYDHCTNGANTQFYKEGSCNENLCPLIAGNPIRRAEQQE